MMFEDRLKSRFASRLLLAVFTLAGIVGYTAITRRDISLPAPIAEQAPSLSQSESVVTPAPELLSAEAPQEYSAVEFQPAPGVNAPTELPESARATLSEGDEIPLSIPSTMAGDWDENGLFRPSDEAAYLAPDPRIYVDPDSVQPSIDETAPLEIPGTISESSTATAS